MKTLQEIEEMHAEVLYWFEIKLNQKINENGGFYRTAKAAGITIGVLRYALKRGGFKAKLKLYMKLEDVK